MKGYIVLVVVVSSVFCQNQKVPVGIEIGEEKDIYEINKDSSHDDIMTQTNVQRTAVIDDRRLWTSPLPYVLEDDLEVNAKGVIMRAFDQFRLKTCIDFKPRHPDDEDYISVQKLGGCYSYIGRVTGKQELSIGRYCDEISTVEHEFLHALGFYHEQSRYDRDDYVTIVFENIESGKENNFLKVREGTTTTNGVPYDYWSVMHYGQNFFTNGNGSTIITKDPKFQDVIGQRREMSPSDVLELNRRYKCNSTVAFNMYCGFINGGMCQMKRCSQSSSSWEIVKYAMGGPNTDHTSLPSGTGGPGNEGGGHFMHASTASGMEGDTAWLETHRMNPSRDCHVQCLQFYYYHSGHESDILNIWIREFRDEQDVKGTARLIDQITGSKTSHWQIKHVSLNATKHFQVEFEAIKGVGMSSGGFSIDDINLSEIECPHVTIQINNFEHLMNISASEMITSPRQYSSGGYAYRIGVTLYRTYLGVFVQFLSGKYDKELQWPCINRQMTFQALDQTPNIQNHMSKQRSFTSDNSKFFGTDDYIWGNPRDYGNQFIDDNNETIYAGPWLGRNIFVSLEEMKSRDFLKGGSAVFVFSFQDLTPIGKGSTLPCPKLAPAKIVHPPKGQDNGPCSTRILPTTRPPTTHPPPKTTEDGSIFGFSPAMVASPVLTFLLALILLIP